MRNFGDSFWSVFIRGKVLVSNFGNLYFDTMGS
jgi:hypothetical protein